MPKLTLAFKGQALAVYHLKNGRAFIGRDTDCTIHIDSLAIAPHHVELVTVGEFCRVKALGAEYPLYVNEVAVENAPLVHGDVLRVGKHTLAFATDGVVLGTHVDDGDLPEQKMPPSLRHESDRNEKVTAYIQILSGAHIGRIIPLASDMMRLGTTGGDYAMVAHRFNGHYLSCQEGNRVTIDGVPIGNENVLLNDGSIIQIGAVKLRFYH